MFALNKVAPAYSHKRFDYGKYLQLQYSDDARDGVSGSVDCWGLVRLIYLQELAIELPTYSEIHTKDILNVLKRMHVDSTTFWHAVKSPAVFDVVAMTAESGRRIAHVGLLIDPHNMIHADQGVGVCIQAIDHPLIRTRIVGFYRHGSRLQ